MKANVQGSIFCSAIWFSLLVSIQAAPIPSTAGLESPFGKRGCCCDEIDNKIYAGHDGPTFGAANIMGLVNTPTVSNTHVYVPPNSMKMEYHSPAKSGPVPASALPAPIMSAKVSHLRDAPKMFKSGPLEMALL